MNYFCSFPTMAFFAVPPNDCFACLIFCEGRRNTSNGLVVPGVPVPERLRRVCGKGSAVGVLPFGASGGGHTRPEPRVGIASARSIFAPVEISRSEIGRDCSARSGSGPGRAEAGRVGKGFCPTRSRSAMMTTKSV